MQNLRNILYKVALQAVAGNTDRPVAQITADSRRVLPNTLFVAIGGTQNNGHNYINAAIEAGATAIMCEVLPDNLHEDIAYLKVNNAAVELGTLAANFYNKPSEKLKLIGITGTNGKTTTATLLYRLFMQLGYQVGLISTVEHRINNISIPSTHTTPDTLTLNKLLSKMVEADCDFCFMEVSSHAVAQHRIAGLQFAGGIFTNITHDHLDYHKTFDNYIAAKKGFFDQLPPAAFALTNLDDKRGKVMLQNTNAHKYTYALKTPADFTAKILENSFAGLMLNLDGEEFHSRLIGEFNAYNLLTIYGTAILLGEPKMPTLIALSNLKAAEGRFEYVRDNIKNITGIVDYAHTPDALEKVLTTLCDIRKNKENIITVVGCGGDRDKTKRPLMAKIACEMSQQVILTSDNPRTEDPNAILNDMQQGITTNHIKKILKIENRREAIKTACALAQNGDIILIAGKGHEKYQEINGIKYPFDDMEILKEILTN